LNELPWLKEYCHGEEALYYLTINGEDVEDRMLVEKIELV